MTVHIPADDEAWLRAEVAAGRFSSLEEALTAAIARLKAETEIDDLWAKPLIAEALDALNRGNGTPWVEGEALARIKARHAGD